jgi:ribosome maturation factor RimP
VGRDLKLVLVNGTKTEGKLVECSESGITLEQERKEKIEGKKKKELVVERSNHLFSEIKEAKIIITFK